MGTMYIGATVCVCYNGSYQSRLYFRLKCSSVLDRSNMPDICTCNFTYWPCTSESGCQCRHEGKLQSAADGPSSRSRCRPLIDRQSLLWPAVERMISYQWLPFWGSVGSISDPGWPFLGSRDSQGDLPRHVTLEVQTWVSQLWKLLRPSHQYGPAWNKYDFSAQRGPLFRSMFLFHSVRTSHLSQGALCTKIITLISNQFGVGQHLEFLVSWGTLSVTSFVFESFPCVNLLGDCLSLFWI